MGVNFRPILLIGIVILFNELSTSFQMIMHKKL